MPEMRNMNPEEMSRFDAWLNAQRSRSPSDQATVNYEQEFGNTAVDPASEAVFDQLTGLPWAGIGKAFVGGTGMAVLGRRMTKAEAKSQAMREWFEGLQKKAYGSGLRADTETTIAQKLPKSAPPAYTSLPEAVSMEAGTDAMLEMDAEQKLIAHLTGKKRLNPRELMELPSSLLEKLPGSQRAQVMKTMVSDYKGAGIPAGFDEQSGKLLFGDRGVGYNIPTIMKGEEPSGTALNRLLNDYKWKDEAALYNKSPEKAAYDAKMAANKQRNLDDQEQWYVDNPPPANVSPIKKEDPFATDKDGWLNWDKVPPYIEEIDNPIPNNVTSIQDWIRGKKK